MSPGPEPISLARLKHYTWVAAKLLFLLRDGRKGVLFQADKEFLEITPVKEISAKHSPSEIEGVLRKLKSLERNGSLTVELPINPTPEFWVALKQARSEHEINDVADKIAQWDRQQGLGYTPMPSSSQQTEYDFLQVMRLHAQVILEAKNLPEYPKSKRPKSDDKRIWFFSKVLAGLMLGRSPLYTLKRLSGWHGEGFPEPKGAGR